MLKEYRPFEDTGWMRINMRKVTNLLGVEFIHNLYNRHVTRINSIRFRNTITIWKDGIVNSFAPDSEWESLNVWLSDKFFSLDPNLINELKILLKEDRTYFNKLIKKYKKIKFSKLNNTQLAYHLIDLQDIVLGELYQLNFVQIEHSLTLAIKKSLKEILKPEDLDKTLTEIITPVELTEFQKEEINFFKIIKKWKNLDLKDIKKQNKEKLFYKDIKKHSDKYGHMHCAYGELPKMFNDYIKDYENRYSLKVISLKDLDHKNKIKKQVLKKIKNKKVTLLSNLLSKGGTFRDHNKANLGQTLRYKYLVLDTIAFRKIENRSNLNYYLLSEILDLLKNNKKLDNHIIEKRKSEGIVFVRSEYTTEINDFIRLINGEPKNFLLKGQCASVGIVEGTCKLIFSKNDIQKMNNGDIMVAIGTDFDLMDAINNSAAVITEEGGLLSHAAVVCREMNKPCCIGVKNATKIIKDGDRIKLNATKGIIDFL